MPAIKLDDVALDYIEQGSGTPLIFVHGSLDDLRTWEFQIDPLAEHHQVVAYTRRHYHGSEDVAPRRPPSASTAADDLISVIEKLRLAPAHVAGSSYGALTAMLATVKRPDLVRSLVLGEPPAASVLLTDDDGTRVWDKFLKFAYTPGREKIAAGDIDGGLRAFIDGVVGDGAWDMMPPPVQDAMRDNAHILPLEAAPTDPFGVAEAGRVTMPVLFVTGEHSPSMFAEITDRLRRLLPHAEHVEIPAASHGMHAENAPAYNSAVQEFLSRH